MKLRVFLDARLAEENALFGIQAHTQPVHHHLPRALLDSLWRGIVGRQRVPIRNKEKTAVVLLQSEPVLQGAVEMAEMETACRTGAANDSFHEASFQSIPSNNRSRK